MTYFRFTRLLAAGFLIVTFAASHAAAKSSSDGGGRIYNSSKLRTQRETAPHGRNMKRPAIPDPEDRIPLRPSALIPNPEPSSRGGTGFQRNGKYFYATPRDIELKRTKAGYGYNPTIPRPEPVGLDHRPKTTTSSSSKKSSSTTRSGSDYYSVGSSTGSLGNFDDR